MDFISPSQCRAARGLLNWSQPDLAQKSGVHVQTISSFENETSTPTKTTLEKIKFSFEKNNIEFLKNHGVSKNDDPIIKYEGPNCYAEFLSDALEFLKETKDEYLLSSADDRRSPPRVIKLCQDLRKNKIPMRQLIEGGNTYIMGDLDEYRWMPNGLFIDTDVKIIYADRVAYVISWANTQRVIVIKDKAIAEEAKRQFNFVWNLSKKPTHSTSEIKF